MIPLLVPEIEGGYPEHHGGEGAEGEEEGLVLEYSSGWMFSTNIIWSTEISRANLGKSWQMLVVIKIILN